MIKVGPMFKWFGSKWQSAKRYPQPIYGKIIEPFAGGAGYSLNYSDRQIVLDEADPNLRLLWKWLINSAAGKPSLIRDIPLDMPVGFDIRRLELEHGQALLLKHWQRTNNVGDCWTISPWGNMPGQWTANTRARLADEVGAIAHWEIGDPYTNAHIDEPATWFIDPPYQFNYRYRKDLPDVKYDRFDSLVQTISKDSLIIVCEAVGKKGEIPDYLPFSQSHNSVTSRRKPDQSHHSKELVYIRQPAKEQTT